MTLNIHLRKIEFIGPKKNSDLSFKAGVNVICGASDTGKSYLAEAIDFMLGGSSLREIPESRPYAQIALNIETGENGEWRLIRALEGGNFALHKKQDGDEEGNEKSVLSPKHSHGRTDNISGFLLENSSLLEKRILKSVRKGTTQSLSFRNLARLIVVDEGEVQKKTSPFLSGQFVSKTSELATVKLLLSGIDDSHIISDANVTSDTVSQISLVNELIADLEGEIADLGKTREELSDQLSNLKSSIDDSRDVLSHSQRELNSLLSSRRDLVKERQIIQVRIDDIENLLARFSLLNTHYEVDLERLQAIQESGSMFAHIEQAPCPLCGAKPESQHLDESCDGDVGAIVEAASAEVSKIEKLKYELASTVESLHLEQSDLTERLARTVDLYNELDNSIQEGVAPQVDEMRSSFSDLIETRSEVEKAFSLFERMEKLEAKKAMIENDEKEPGQATVAAGLPDAIAHDFSLKVSEILKAWNFPGNCLVHFDKERSDFIIDGKPRGSRGKGLRAITHAAVTVGLLEYCQEHDLPHPGFVVIDSPLLAYFEPEGDEDEKLKGSDLKDRFYEYLIQHHQEHSQIIIIENQHPPASYERQLSMTVFTGNPSQGRQGLL